MENDGSSVTLIFYRVGERWWKEPLLNIIAAAAQMSNLTHVEIAIGEEAGTNGMMKNVCRVFNDKYVYQQLGCSRNAVQKMLHYARTRCVGKPFSNMGMARSLLWPRHTDSSSFFCAELVAAILKEGGLMDQMSNPGSATPETLFRMYKDRAAVTANPYVLREMQHASGLSFASTIGGSVNVRDLMSDQAAERESLLQQRAILAPMPAMRPAHATGTPIGERRRADSPPRGHFRVITPRGATAAPSSGSFRPSANGATTHMQGLPLQSASAVPVGRIGLSLTLNSLDMSKR